MIQRTLHALPNGLRIVGVDMPHIHSAELALYIKAGGRNDPPFKSGISHFLEHMLFRGTDKYPTSLEIEAAFESLGGMANASTDADTTCFFTRIHPSRIRDGLEILSSMILNPTLEGLEIEKRIITEEALEDYNEYGTETSPDNISARMLWPGHPLGRPTIGELEHIRDFTLHDIRCHKERFYHPANAVIAAAGPLSPEALVRASEEFFGHWTAKPVLPEEKFVPLSRGSSLMFVEDSDSQVSLQVSFRGFSRTDSSIMPLRLIRRILAGSGCSRLHTNLRERLGLTYSVEGSIAAYEDTGCIAFDLATAPENVCRAVDEILHELNRISSEIVSLEEFERVRQAYLYDLDFSRDSAYEMGIRYGWGELAGVVRTIESDRDEVLAVTPEQIRSVAERLFSPDSLCLACVGPVDEPKKEKIRASVNRYGSARSRRQGS